MMTVTTADYSGPQIVASQLTASATVVGRFVFYNNSRFDGNDPHANALDDQAIATDKQALLVGPAATFANYTSYSAGINGVMVDVAGLAGTPTAADFVFQVGNTNSPAGWTTAPAPASITVRHGAGVGGSSRITLTWADGEITNEWLQVNVRATANTGLAQDSFFFFGNMVGSSGARLGSAAVTAIDQTLTRNQPYSLTNLAPITAKADYNRDGLINTTDELVARNTSNSGATPLNFIAARPTFAWGQVVGRYVFYNNSSSDGFNPTANAADDQAIDLNKSALLPGGTATTANFTQYAKGLNGVIIDVSDLPRIPTVDDFEFRVGNDNDPNSWALAPAPAIISVRFNGGANGADRITIIWPDGAIQNAWLRVTIKANANTRLAVTDQFVFGNVSSAAPLVGGEGQAALGGLNLINLAPTTVPTAPIIPGETGYTDFVKADVVGRSIFYNNSQFDGNNPAANSADYGAIATDKSALLPGGAASFGNVTSYSRGINGIIIDVAGLPDDPTVDDFDFRVGNSSTPGSWAAGPQPTGIRVAPGQGVGGSTRITLVWPDGWIRDTWLQVTVKAVPRTGLKQADVFYFGNLVGESGGAGAPIVTSSDRLGARNNPATIVSPATVTSRYDYNRDSLVNSSDELIASPTGIVLALFTAPAAVAPASAPIRPQQPLFAVGDSGFNVAYAPALIMAPDGTLLALAEGRWGMDDFTSQSIMARRSYDNGVTWTPIETIMSVSDTGQTQILHTPTPVVDQLTGAMTILFTIDNSRVLYIRSLDSGKTWSAPVDITANIKVTADGNPNPGSYPNDPWGWYAVGPGHGIQIQNGPYAGRLVIACDHRLSADTSGASWSHVIYSDDGGITWHLGGGLTQTNPVNNYSNEVTVEETTDGALYMAVRINPGGIYNGRYKGYTYSYDGGATWTPLWVNTALTTYDVQATLLRINSNTVLFASPDSLDSTRQKMTIWVSHDNMQTWTKTKTLSFLYAGYSDMVLVGPDTVLIAYNSGHAEDGGSADYVSLARFNLRWLESSDPDQFQWNFNEQAPGTAAQIDGEAILDSSKWENRSGARANSTAEAPVYIDGRNAGDAALRLTGGSDNVLLTPLRTNALFFEASDSFTFEFVMRTSDTNGVILGSSPLFDFPSVTMQLVDGYFRMNLWDRQLRSIITTTNRINDGQWHHIAAVRNTATRQLSLYVDGVLAAAPVSDITGRLTGIGPVTLGAYNDGTGQLAMDIDTLKMTRAVVAPNKFLPSSYVAPPVYPAPQYPSDAPTSIAGLKFWLPAYDPTRFFSDMTFSDPIALNPVEGTAVHTGLDASGSKYRVSVSATTREVRYTYDGTVGASWVHDAANAGAGEEWIVQNSNGTSPNNFDFVQNTGKFTLSTFIKSRQDFGGYMTLFDTAQGRTENSGFTLLLQPNGSLQMLITGPDGTIRYNQTTAPGLIAKDAWYHVAVVGNGVDQPITIYITSAAGATVTAYTPAGLVSGVDGNYPTAVSNNLTIGALSASGLAAFNGQMVDQAVFNRALSQAEIQQLFDYTKLD